VAALGKHIDEGRAHREEVCIDEDHAFYQFVFVRDSRPH
jgi:hypothetical protein